MIARTMPNKRRSWMEIDHRIGLLLCATGGGAFAVAVSGWILIFSELTELKARIQGVREERVLLATEVKTTVQKLELKLEALGNKLDNLESLTRSGRDRADLRDTRLTEMQDVVRRLLVDHQESTALPRGGVR